jgi:hypothetical protein
LKEAALYRTLWRTRFGRGYGPVVRQTTEWMDEWIQITCLHVVRRKHPGGHRPAVSKRKSGLCLSHIYF